MKTNLTVENNGNAGAGSALKTACVTSCKKILAQIGAAKANIFAEVTRRVERTGADFEARIERSGGAGLADGLSASPVPALATEEISGRGSWNQHQQSIRRTKLVTAF